MAVMDNGKVDGAGTGSVYTAGSINNFGNLVNINRIEAGTLFTESGLINGFSEVDNEGTIKNVQTLKAGVFSNMGRLEPGNGIGKMSVLGDFVNYYEVSPSESVLAIDIRGTNAPTSGGNDNDLIEVSGSATITGGVAEVSVMDNDRFYRSNVKYTFLYADTLSVEEELIASEGSAGIPLFHPELGYDAKKYWLNLQRDYIYGPQGDTFNPSQLGGYIDSIGSAINLNSDMADVLVALDALNAGGAPGVVSGRALHALDEMSGALYGTVSTIALQHASMINNTIADRLREWDNCPRACNNWNAWGMAYGLGGSSQFDGNASGYKYSVAGTVIGLDRQVNQNNRMGAYFAVGSTNTKLKGLVEKAESTDIFTGLYFNGNDNDCLYTTLFAGFGYNDFEAKRTITFVNRQTESAFDGYQANFYGERGVKVLVAGKHYLQPYIALQYIGLNRTGIDESGADALDLNVDSERTRSLRTMLGAKFTTELCFNNVLYNGHARAAWAHEYLDTCSFAYAQMSNPNGAYFESNSTFQVRGNDSGRDWGMFGLGLDTDLSKHAKLFGNYDCMVNGQQAIHTGNLGLEFGW